VFKIKTWHILVLISLLGFAFRLYFVLQTNNFSDDSAYFTIRQTEHIKESFLPITEDELSYGGRTFLYPPLFFYLLAFFNLFLPKLFVYKVLPIIFISFLPFILYKIIKLLVDSEKVALTSTAFGTFMPIVIGETLNKISVYSILLPLILLFIYLLLRIEEHQQSFILLSFILLLLHPIAILIALSLIVFVIISYTEEKNITKVQKEGILFFILLTLLIEFIFFKKAFLDLGLDIIWQNTPAFVLENFFKEFTIAQHIYLLGIFPLIFGIWGTIIGFKKEGTEQVFLIGSFLITTFTLLFLKMIPYSIGVMFLGLFVGILSSFSFESASNYLERTKLLHHKSKLVFLFILILFASMLIPAFYNAREIISNALSNEDIEAFQWIKQKTSNNSVVLTSLNEGHMLTAIAKRKNMMDTNFLYIPHINQRMTDLNTMYTTEFESKALELFKKYNIKYILVTKETKNFYNIQKLRYVDDKECFRGIPGFDDTEIYWVIC